MSAPTGPRPTMRVAVPDLVSPSYFPAIAAIELGLAREEGLDAQLELLFPVTDAAAALRDGRIDALAGAAHAPFHAFDGFAGARLVAALSQRTYWFLVVRSDRAPARGDLDGLHDLRLGAAPGPDLALHRLLAEAGVDPAARSLRIGPVPGGVDAGISFGVTAAEALADGRLDGFWANGMGAEVAVRRGTGAVVLDARRGDGPPGLRSYTFPALSVTDATFATRRDEVEALRRAVVRAQEMLREDPQRAREVGERLFPPVEAGMIAELIARDAPFYDPGVDAAAAAGLVAFARACGLTEGEVDVERLVTDPVRT